MTTRIFLDLDGTLTDPKPGITRSIRHALTELGLEAPPEEALTWCIGPPLAESLTHLTGGDPERAAEALTLYRARFGEVGLFENAVCPGIIEAMMAMRATGAKLYLATSKPHVYATRIVAHFGLAPILDGVFGSELDGTRAQKPDLLAHALAETGGPGGVAVMVGDRRHDIEGARANRIPALGVLWGYGGEAELRQARADALVETPGDLLGAIADILQGAAP
ncbi:MAG: HAD family hydrolase [Pseudomonadota bacterium]